MVSRRTRRLTVREAVRRAAKFAAEKQAIDIVVLDLRKITDFTDYFVICSGAVDVHVKAIYEHIERELLQKGWKPKHVEGGENLRWVLLDYVDFLIHVFQPDIRGYYSLERLWGDSQQVIIKGING